ncbi:hypothetical protein FHS56_000819 [Thermonema lapsum]|uniref:Uncharacterized protein n=1 Tax=Thermonema lapsum TaxID=28195 RepID=A0A846MP47_9BACT|nr:hypothetical protein [Thermonema lapsum]NIK73333.1 hypothetical protein [Thermonema lapsum]
MIARLFNISRRTVLYWIRTMGRSLSIPEIDTEVKEVQIDEMWHLKNKSYGSGEPWIVLEVKPSDGLLAIVMLEPSRNYMND